MRKYRVLFVCMANICRSPMAEYLLRNLNEKRNRGDHICVEVRSAGLMNTTGANASDQALMVMRERGIDMSRHQARQVNDELIDWSDLILCMERVHAEAIRKDFPRASGKTFLLTEYCGVPGEIIDPTGRNYLFFRECAEQMEGLLGRLLDKLTGNGIYKPFRNSNPG